MSQTPRYQKKDLTIDFEEKNDTKEGNMGNILKNKKIESFKDIQWLTNVVEPEQQRGPSENP